MAAAEKLYFHPIDFLESLFADLQLCRSSVDIEMYIWELDDLTEKLEDVLFELVERGVKVRLLLDAFGSYTWIKKRRAEVESRGIVVRVFHPLPGLVHAFQLGPALNSLNHRCHRKIIIIDNKISYMGSFNMTATSENWRETIVRIDNSTVAQIAKLFEAAWDGARDIFSEVVHMHSRRFTNRHHFVKLVRSAHKRIWLVTPYFNPPHSLLRALRRAASRGVDVRLLLPEHNDVPYMRWMAQQHYLDLIRYNVKIYEYQRGVLHAKTAVIDDLGIVGSANLNHRSFFKDAELSLVLTQKLACAELAIQFLRDLKHSQQITEPDSIASWKKAAINILFLVKDSL